MKITNNTKLGDGVTNLGKKKIKRLIWDIETSFNIVSSWKVGYNINLGPENIIHERKIICIGYKWYGEKGVTVLTWDKNQDDKEMLRKFLEVANESDEMIFHNGDNFDLPWFKTRCLFHGFEPLPNYKTVDTLQWARKYFYFNSNKLDYIAKYLGIGCKIHTGHGLWKEIVLNKCAASLKKMVEYCANDVILLEEVWEKLRFYVNKPKTHAGVLMGNSKFSCPHCGSDKIIKSKTRVTAAGTIQHQMQCKSCGGYNTISDALFKSE